MKKSIIIILSLIILAVIAYFGFKLYKDKLVINNLTNQSENNQVNSYSSISTNIDINGDNIYKNTEFGIQFTLPKYIVDYKIIATSSSEGLPIFRFYFLASQDEKWVCDNESESYINPITKECYGEKFEIYAITKQYYNNIMKECSNSTYPGPFCLEEGAKYITINNLVYTTSHSQSFTGNYSGKGDYESYIFNSLKSLYNINTSSQYQSTSENIYFAPQNYYLQYGDNDASTSGEVSKLQNFLIEKGFYQGSITGSFDESTKQAVINYQKSKGLTAEGLVGNMTRREMNGDGSESNMDDSNISLRNNEELYLYKNPKFNFQMMLPIEDTQDYINDRMTKYDGSTSLWLGVSSSTNLKDLTTVQISQHNCDSGKFLKINNLVFVESDSSGDFSGMESYGIARTYCIMYNDLSYFITLEKVFPRYDSPEPNITEVVNEFRNEMNTLNFQFINKSLDNNSTVPKVVLNSFSSKYVNVGDEITIYGSGFLHSTPTVLQDSFSYTNSYPMYITITNYPFTPIFSDTGYLWAGKPTKDNSISVKIPSRVCKTIPDKSNGTCKKYMLINTGLYTINVNGYGLDKSNDLVLEIYNPKGSQIGNITFLEPSSGKVGSTIKIHGSNFTGDEVITIDGEKILYLRPYYVSPDGTELDFKVPNRDTQQIGKPYNLTLNYHDNYGNSISSNGVDFTFTN